MAAEGLPVQLACRVLGVSESGYYIREVHLASRGTYGARRVHAELVLGRGILVGHQAIELLMHRAGIKGLTGRSRYRRAPHAASAADLVKRDFARSQPDQL